MADGSILRLLTWRAGGLRCGAPTDRVREVLPCPAITPVPSGSDAVRGVANVRGGLVTVVDSRVLLGEPTAGDGSEMVLVEVQGRPVGLLVDHVEDLVTVEDRAMSKTGSGVWEVRVGPGDRVRLLDPEQLLGPLFES